MTLGLHFLVVFTAASLAMGQETSRPAPLIDANTANLPAQRIGANDLIAITVYRSPEFTRTIRVSSEGLIRLPILEQPIQAAGRMPNELERTIAAALKGAGLLVDPLVTVTVVEYKSRPISVMGAVRKPVTFQAAGPLTLLEALARAEGIANDAGHEVLVTKADDPSGLVRRIPLKELMAGTDSNLNLKLTGGEDIRVPETGKIFVLGNVKKPGAFGIGEEKGTSVMKALALAEGLTPFSAKRAIIYRREAAGSVNELPIELAKIMDRKLPDEPLQANDVLYIPDAKGKRMGWAAVERILLFGSGATTAVIYGTMR